MRKILLIITLLITIHPMNAHADEEVYNRVMASKTINCGYFGWPPYIMKDANTGKITGINYDVMEMVAKKLDLKINWVSEVGVGEVAEALNTNKFDVMCATVWPDPGRVANLTLSDPTFYSVVHAFVRADDKRFDGDLSKANKKEIKVSAIDADITAAMAIEKLPNAQIVSLPQMAAGNDVLLQVITKKADIALVDEGLVNKFMEANPGTLRKVQGIPPVHVFGEVLPVKRGEYQLRDMINTMLVQLSNDGSIEELTKKYSKDYKSEFIAPAKGFAR